MRVFLVIILLAVGFLQTAQAQQELREVEKRAETYMMSRISDQLIDELNDFPINIRRMAVYKINYNSDKFSNESIAFIKGEIETVFRENTSVSVISPPELDPTDKLKIVGTDSTLRLMNIKGRSLADMSPELLESVSDKYSLSGLAELTLQRHMTEGLVVQIRIMSPQSREIVWARSIAAYPIGIQEKDDTGKNVVLRFGTTIMSNEFFTNPFAPDIENPVETSSLNYNFNFGYRQSFNEDNSGYLGFYTGFNIIRSNASVEFEANFWELGISFDQAISSKNEEINDYRVMLGLDSSVWLAMGEKKGA